MRRSFMHYMLPASMLSLAVPSFLGAQSSWPVERGDRLRVTTAGPGPLIGKLASIENGDLILSHATMRQGGSTFKRPPSRIPLSSIVKLEVGGRPGAGGRIVGGTLLGMLAGGFVAGALGSRATKDCSCDDPGYGVLLAIPGGLVGALLGGAVGYGRSPDVWTPVAVPGSGQPGT